MGFAGGSLLNARGGPEKETITAIQTHPLAGRAAKMGLWLFNSSLLSPKDRDIHLQQPPLSFQSFEPAAVSLDCYLAYCLKEYQKAMNQVRWWTTVYQEQLHSSQYTRYKPLYNADVCSHWRIPTTPLIVCFFTDTSSYLSIFFNFFGGIDPSDKTQKTHSMVTQ